MSIIIQTLIMLSSSIETKKKILLPLFDEFLLHLQTDNYSQETMYNYERDLLTLTYFLEHEVQKEFEQITKVDVERYKAYLLSTDRKTAISEQETSLKLQSGSINRILSSFRSYLKFLIFQDYKIPVVPESVRMVRKEKKHYKVAELNELISLIESPSTFEKNSVVATRNRAMLEVLFATGMRISELLSLNRRDIDSSGRIFIIGKGKKERFVYLTERAKFYVDNYLKLRKDALPALFVPQKGKRMGQRDCRISPNYLQAKIKSYREKLGIIVPTSAHSLRHGFATYLAEEGASPVAIQMLLGHESLNTTTRYVNASDRFAEDSHRRYHPLAERPEK
ncbi:MAG: tyrosine-type recombinase/integrase [Candidatus Daviesbacteria bacterium]|nr:tyrosine-type recombinase/integrase [Candidatus Daviesbacteria bacterium]